MDQSTEQLSSNTNPEKSLADKLTNKDTSTEEAKEIFKLVKEMMSDKNIRNALVSKMSGDPIQGSRTYYHKKHADEIIPILDDMIKDKADRFFAYADYLPYWQPATVWLKLNQAVKYIVDHLDKEGIYAKLRIQFQIERRADGVAFIFRRDSEHNLGSIKFKARIISGNSVVEPDINWKTTVFSFLEDDTKDDGKRISIKEIELSPDDLNMLHDLLDDNEQYVSTITSTKIIITYDPAGRFRKLLESNEEAN